MVYYDVHPLGDLIREFIVSHKGSDYLDEMKVLNSWKDIVGSFVASHTIDLSVKNGVLYVRVDSDALRNELSYSKSLLLKNLNERVGKEILKEIVLN